MSGVAARYIERQSEFKTTTLGLDDRIYEIMNSKGHLVYIDEAVFK